MSAAVTDLTALLPMALLLGGLLCGWALTGFVTSLLRARALLDRPGERSSHTVPTPRGGGWGFVLPTLFVLTAIISLEPSPILLAVCFGGVALALVSWWDDLRNAVGRHVPILLRLAVQILAVIPPLALILPSSGFLEEFAPLWLERALLALLWLWLINLFNFMDGIDSLAAGESIAILFGWLMIAAILMLGGAAVSYASSMLALVLLAGLAGFLRWNLPPARVFMGDVGSVFLGYILGFLLLQLALAGAWGAALILPLAFLGDATLTLFKRLVRGDRVWHAHREHAYQRAVQRGEAHGAVSLQFALLNVFLIALAVTSLLYPWSSLAAAFALTIAFLLRLGRKR